MLVQSDSTPVGGIGPPGGPPTWICKEPLVFDPTGPFGTVREGEGEKLFLPCDGQGLRAVRGLAGPHDWRGVMGTPVPIGVVVGSRRPAAFGTTSSSSAASADDPRTPFGLGDRWLGDPDPELVVPSVVVVPGRAIGAIGRVMGPGPPGPREARRPEENICEPGVEALVKGVLPFGGPIGVWGLLDEERPPDPPREIGTPIGGMGTRLKETAGSKDDGPG